MADLIDFDATLADAEGEESTFPFRFLGQEWQLPVSPVAKDMLKVRRMYMRVAELGVKQATGEITEADASKMIEVAGGSELDDLLAMMIGRSIVVQWLDLGMSDDQLKKVFRYLWRLYNGRNPNEADPGEAEPPVNRGQRRTAKKAATKATRSRSSSKTSDTSTPTSAGNTASKSLKR